MPQTAFKVKLELNGEVVGETDNKELFLDILASLRRTDSGTPAGHRRMRAAHVDVDTTDEQRPRTRAATAGTRGATAVLRRMVEDGFFGTPRTGRETQECARERYRAVIATNNVHAKLGDLVITGLLDRKRGDDKVFRYQVKAKRRAKGAAAEAPAPRHKTQPHETPTAVRGERAGAQSLLRRLVKEGFFRQPRTTGEVRAHAKDSFGRALTNKETPKALLRLMRDGLLTRAMGSAGEYEYTACTARAGS